MTIPPDKISTLNAKLEAAGASKTVYAFVMPETEAALDRVLDADRESIRDMYRGAWTHKQDNAHREFFDTWKAWSAPVLKFDHAAFPHFYPTAGASEALREAVYALSHKARAEGFLPMVHIFEGEYEGYGAYAKAAGMIVRTHRRDKWEESIHEIGAKDLFFISQPSAIDGNVWKGFDDFVAALNQQQPDAGIILDATYVGAVAKPFTVEALSPNIRSIAFSLSKPMGVYYHRIGGIVSRDEMPGLWGNMWFKNLLSLKLGTQLMKTHDVCELPRKYALLQTQAATVAGWKLGLELEQSDVFLLATVKPSAAPGDLERYLARAGKARVCLTATMADMAANMRRPPMHKNAPPRP